MTAGLLLTAAATVYTVMRDDGGQPLTTEQEPSDRLVTVKVNPPWAGVKLDGRVVGPADPSGKLTLPLPVGAEANRWLEVEADGYHSDRRPLSVYGGVDEVFIELVRTPYDVAIDTQPARAEVYVNDKLKGYSPLTLSLLPEKEAYLSIRRKGYEPVSQTLRPPEKGSRVELSLALEASGPALHVETEPSGARIVADGIPQGVTPLDIRLDASYLGKELAIVASAPGHDEAATNVHLPLVGRGDPEVVRLVLTETLSEVELLTVPPGGRVIIDGKDLGAAPVTAKFEPTQTGKSVVVQASLAGSYYGREELIVPPAGDPLRVTVPMDFNAQRVVFLLSLARGTVGDRLTLADQVVELIHSLSPKQRFAVLAQSDEGLRAWPGGLGTQAATSEQKVRAYDMLRSLRPGGEGSVLEMMQTSLGFQPSTIWLLTAGEPDRDELLQFSDWAEGRDVSIHLVRTASSANDAWLERWAADHHGTLTVLGRDELPIVAIDEGDRE